MKKSKPDQTPQASPPPRREFLKKAAYVAPRLILLGPLVRPQNAAADFSGGPVGPPLG